MHRVTRFPSSSSPCCEREMMWCSRSRLNEHHIIFRSQQGDDEEGNLVTLFIGHHQQGVHDRHVRCFRPAPGALWWELGVRPDGRPLLQYFGERLVTHRPWVRPQPDVRTAPLGAMMPPVAAPPAQMTRLVPTTPRAIAGAGGAARS